MTHVRSYFYAAKKTQVKMADMKQSKCFDFSGLLRPKTLEMAFELTIHFHHTTFSMQRYKNFVSF